MECEDVEIPVKVVVKPQRKTSSGLNTKDTNGNMDKSPKPGGDDPDFGSVRFSQTPVIKREKSAENKAEKKKKRKSIVSSFTGRTYAFRRKEPRSHATQSSETEPASSGTPPAVISDTPVVLARTRTPDESASLPGSPAALPEGSGEDRDMAYSHPVSPVAEEPIYDQVATSPVSEASKPLPGDAFTIIGANVGANDGADVSGDDPLRTTAAVRASLGLPPASESDLARARRADLTWIPPGLEAEDVDEFYADRQPRRGTAGALRRQLSLLRQVPTADLAPAPDAAPGTAPGAASGAASELAPLPREERERLREFAAARDAVALGEGRVVRLAVGRPCGGCDGAVAAGELAVSAEPLPGAWHPACFRCATCGEPLADLVHCRHQGRPLCLRHYGEQFKERCVGCDALIFCGAYVRAHSLAWHREHLACSACGVPLADAEFGLHERSPFCLECYQSASVGTCHGCEGPVGAAERRARYGPRQWHAACFACGWCTAPLEGRPFALREDRAVCAACRSRPPPPPAPRCGVCGLPVAADSPSMESKAGVWHEACFVCCTCRVPLGERTFLPKDQQLFCSRCYEETFSARCAKCQGTITSLGVTYQGETWHRECFLCTRCESELAGQKFRTHEERPYCRDCWRELFGKRCDRCRKHIPQERGTRYSAFESRCWHNECFACAECSESLVGKGFVDLDSDVFCSSCATKRQAAKLADRSGARRRSSETNGSD